MYFNFDFFKRKKIIKFLRFHFLSVMSLVVLSAYLAKDRYPAHYSFIFIPLLMFYSWLAHIVFGHIIPYNTHLVHHMKNIPRSFDLLVETFTDISFFVVPYVAQKLIGITVIPTLYLLFYGIVYVSIHIINYSMFSASPTHKKHHIEKEHPLDYCNYGPDTIDHLFGTNCNDYYENQLHHIPNIIASFFIVKFFMNYNIV